MPVSEPAALGYAATMSLTLHAADGRPVKSRVFGTAELQVDADSAELIVHTSEESCVYRGPIAQEGRFTKVSGVFACTDGRGGSVDITELEFSRNGFVARISMSTPRGLLQGTVAGAAR